MRRLSRSSSSGRVLPGEGARRASRSSSRGSVSPGKHASGAGKFRAAGVDNSTLRRIVGGTSEQRIQCFEAGQARFVQWKSFAGEERAEPAGACPAAAFRREAARWADNSTLRRIVGGTSEQRIQCFEAGQAWFVQRKKFAGKPRVGAAAEDVLLRRIAGERPSEQRVQRFEAGQARFVQRKSFAGEERAEPVGACPAAAFRREAARWADDSTLRRIGGGSVRAADSTLRSRSGAVRPAEGFCRGGVRRVSRSSSRGSVSPGKHASGAGKFRAAGVDNSTLRRIVGGTSEQRIQRFEAGQARFVQRKKFAGKPRAGAAAEGVLLRRIAGERPSEQRVQRFEAGQARFVQRKSFAGEERAEPAGACPAAAFRREATRWALGRSALRGRRFYAP